MFFSFNTKRNAKLVSFLLFFALAAVLLRYSVGQMTSNLVKDSEINQLVTAVHAYASVALACGDKSGYAELKERLIKIVELAKTKDQLTAYGVVIASDVDSFVRSGVEDFKKRPLITCSEYEKLGSLGDLKHAADQLLRFNQ